MKKIFFLSFLFLSSYGNAALKINPATSRLDVVGVVSLSTNTSGANNFIWNTSVLQTGATFYVSSGTINSYFQVGDNLKMLFDATQSDAILILKDTGSAGWALRFNDNTSFNGNTVGSLSMGSTSMGLNLASASVSGIFALTRFTIGRQSGDFTFQDNEATEIFRIHPSSTNLRSAKPLLFFDSDNSNYIGVKSPSSVGSNFTWTLPTSDAGKGRAVISSDGAGTWTTGLSSAAFSGGLNNFPMGDASGSLQGSILSFLASYPIFTGGIVFSNENILAVGDMGGTSASLVNGALNAKMSWGVGPSFSTFYRANVPDSPPGAYQVWMGTGAVGDTFQFQNTTVIVSTNGLQSGATFYVSSGTVTNIQVSTVNFNDGSKLAVAPEKEYWWPGSATQPLEASADSIAPIAISTGTNLDVLSLSFDSATDECREIDFYVSSNTLVSVSTVTFFTRWFSLTATTGNAGFYFSHNSGAQDGESWDATLQTHSSTFDSVKSTVSQITETSWDVAVSSLTWRGGDVVTGKLCRDADNGSDTLVGDAQMQGVGVRFKRR